jgi:hypothetical protein
VIVSCVIFSCVISEISRSRRRSQFPRAQKPVAVGEVNRYTGVEASFRGRRSQFPRVVHGAEACGGITYIIGGSWRKLAEASGRVACWRPSVESRISSKYWRKLAEDASDPARAAESRVRARSGLESTRGAGSSDRAARRPPSAARTESRYFSADENPEQSRAEQNLSRT